MASIYGHKKIVLINGLAQNDFRVETYESLQELANELRFIGIHPTPQIVQGYDLMDMFIDNQRLIYAIRKKENFQNAYYNQLAVNTAKEISNITKGRYNA